MKTLRILALTSFVAGFGLMTSCNSTASSSAPEITQFETANFTDATDTWTSGMDLEFYGTAKDDNNVKTLKLDIVSSTGTVAFTSTKNVSGTSVDFGANKSTVFTINNPGTWTAGAYTATLTATDNDGLTATKSITLAKVAGTGTVTPTGTAISSQGGPFTIGAQKADSASFISVTKAADFATITSGGKTSADEANIDVVFFADNSGTPSFFSPAEAKAQALGKVSSWSTWNNTVIVSAGSTTLSTVEAVKALTDNSSSHSVAVTANTWYAIKLDNSKGYGAIHILTLSGNGQSASATISLFE